MAKRLMIAVVTIFVLAIFIVSCSTEQRFSQSLEEAERRAINSPNSNYSSYVKIKSGSLKMHKERSGTIDDLEFDDMQLSIRFENITDKPIDFDVQIFYSQEFTKFTDNVNSRLLSASNRSTQILPNKGYTCETSIAIRNRDTLSVSQKQEFDRLKNLFIIEMKINNVIFSSKIDLNELSD